MDNQASTLVSAPSARTFPSRWTPLTLGLAAALIVGLVALLSPNLGAATVNASIVCLVAAVVGLGSLLLDKNNARLRWLLASLILLAVSASAFLLSGPVYGYVATSAQAHGDFQTAVTALQANGEKPPYSTKLAQLYLDWAAADLKAHAYESAVAHLEDAAQKFPTTQQAAQAQAELPGAHLAWAQYAAAQNDAVAAGQQYAVLLNQYPASSETTQARGAMPAAFLAWGNALYKAGYYSDANDAYQLIIKNFAQSPEAAQAHAAAALNLSDWSKKLTDAGLYSDASTHLQDLAANYADTPQGQQAKKTLSQGVRVIGRLFKADGVTPAMPGTTLRLSSKWTVSNGAYFATGNQYFARTDANGYFVFTNIPAGQYLLEWHSFTGPYLTVFNNGKPTEIATVLPLQPAFLAPVNSDQK